MTKKKFKSRWTLILLGLLLLAIYLFIFQSKNNYSFFSILLQAIIFFSSLFLCAIFFHYKTDTWGDRATIFVKTVIVIVPVFFLTHKGQKSYIDHQLKTYGIKAPGKIIDTYSESSAGRRINISYFVKYNFLHDGTTEIGEYQVGAQNDFKTGDSIEVIYSSENTNINYILRKK